jgi:glycosyltransferase involved in cell wall biosynthesis
MSRLRVAIDARRLQDDPLGGVGRSLAGMLDLLATEVDVVLVTDARRPPVATDLPQHALGAPPRAPETVWLQWAVRRWLRTFDGVFHGSFNQLPFRPAVPSVVTIHDLSFEVHSEGFSALKRRGFQAQARYAARVASRIVTPSLHARDELVRHYHVDPARIVVTPWGIEPRFGPPRADDGRALRARLGITGRYVVAMGGAVRRGLDVAVAAWQRVRDRAHDVQLVVVGREVPPPAEGLVVAGAVDDDEWAMLLAGADAFCYPTRYEGFGVPALESITSGTPVVCAPVASLPEVLGDAAAWAPTPTVDAIATALQRVLDDRAYADALVRAGLEQAAQHPTWEEIAARTLRAYRDASDG